jgi:hypothetical protein
MNAIKKFFKGSKSNFDQNSYQNEKQAIGSIAENLFTEINPPSKDNVWSLELDNEGDSQVNRGIKKETVGRSNLLDKFLSMNYETKGFEDGNMQLGREIMDQTLRRLESDFRFAVDNVLEAGLSQMQMLKIKQKEWEGASDALYEEYGMRISEAERRLKFLADQKNLSVSGEGIIAPYLHAYKDGFLRGARLAAQEEELFPGLNISLFNK